MSQFRNDTGTVLYSQDFGPLPPGEFDVPGYDPEVHGVIPGCIPLDNPPDKPSGKRTKTPVAGKPGEETIS